MEANNMAALRGALEKIKELNRYDLGCIRSRKRRDEIDAKVLEIERTVRAAISAPARNCDVGTAEEQERRFEAYCHTHFTFDSMKERGGDCRKCPLNAIEEPACRLAWAQMPFAPAEGGAE
jgi:hypothetical protein